MKKLPTGQKFKPGAAHALVVGLFLWASISWYEEHQLTEITNPSTKSRFRKEIERLIPGTGRQTSKGVGRTRNE